MSKTILIADDDAGLCRMLTVRCKHLGLDVRTAHDAMHALVIAHKCEPDLIIMDISMPAGDGLSACEMLKNDQRLMSVPVIILSGTSSESQIQRCEDMDAHFVSKNADIWNNLGKLITGILNISKPQCAS